MNEIIANGLKEQLRVLQLFLNEYADKLNGEILSHDDYETLYSIVEGIKYNN